ncbi:hypothetical protein NMY22_g5438 [Coprinellus aureogranulatus]|nr:hypothetical protein NMY22_g5438 [Coprinellus aureogranulatus]
MISARPRRRLRLQERSSSCAATSTLKKPPVPPTIAYYASSDCPHDLLLDIAYTQVPFIKRIKGRPGNTFPGILPTMTDTLANSIKGEVITPNHPDYSASIARSAEDVAEAISYARANKLPVAVRGGAANPFGKSSVEGGLVIDLSRHLNYVRVDSEKQLAYVGGGATWKNVDEETIKYGFATVGPTVNHTGIGGVTLDGGYGWLTGRHGLAIDSLQQVTIVTEDGSVRTANETSYPDLFWAVRGGGGSFGVVSEFIFKLHQQRRTVYGGRIIFTPDKVAKLIEATNAWYPNIKDDEGMIQVVAVSPTGDPVIAVHLFYNGSEEEGRANFKNFLDIGPVRDDSKELPYEEVNAFMNDKVPHGNCYLVESVTQNAPDQQSIMRLLQKTGELEKGGQYSSYVIFEYFPLAKANSVPASATAHPRGLLPNVLVMLKWGGDSSNKTQEAKALLGQFVEILRKGVIQAADPNYQDGTYLLPSERCMSAF